MRIIQNMLFGGKTSWSDHTLIFVDVITHISLIKDKIGY